eukprot:5876548-Prymnesium_polylepis.1
MGRRTDGGGWRCAVRRVYVVPVVPQNSAERSIWCAVGPVVATLCMSKLCQPCTCTCELAGQGVPKRSTPEAVVDLAREDHLDLLAKDGPSP